MINLTLDQAEQRLVGRSLKIGNVEERRTAGVGPRVVVHQDKQPGTKIRVGQSVNVVVAVRTGTPPPPPPPIWPMVILIGGLGGAAAYVIYKLKTRPRPQVPPAKSRFEAEEGEATQEIVADQAILDMALRLKVVKDAGKQELEAEEPIIPEKDERHD